MNRLYFSQILLLLLLTSSLLITGCKDEETNISSGTKLTKEFDARVPLEWYQLFLEIDRIAQGYRPPAAARMLAYTGLAAYESVVPGMPEYNSLRFEFPGLDLPAIENNKDYHWPSSVNAAYATMFRNFYPHIGASEVYKINALENKFTGQFASTQAPEVLARSRSFGFEVAQAVYKFSETDIDGHNAFLNPRPASYIPPTLGPNGEKLWQPTFPDYTPALFPYWGKVRPFAMSSSDLISRPPLPYSEDPNSMFYQQANETRLWVKNSTYNDRWMAEFWSDDFYQLTFEPAGRQIAIANILVQEDNISLDRAVELYAKMGMSMCDAAIAIWNSKYIYNVRRPIEFIRDVIEPGWTTHLNNPMNGVQSLTPEFPAYPSGHSGFGGAGSAVMAEIFGNVHPYTDNCHQNRTEFLGAPRSFNTILEAGVENAYSRIPLGVHYRMDCDEGLRLGYLAVTRVNELPWFK